jgi:hypothetical protein
MSFTWTGNPSASIIEQIRWEIGDTNSASPKFQDLEVKYAYDTEHSILNAAARLCEQLVATYASSVDRTMGPLRVSLSKQSDVYAKKAADLRKRGMAYAEPYVGGISKAKAETFKNDSDLVQPLFDKGSMDNHDTW